MELYSATYEVRKPGETVRKTYLAVSEVVPEKRRRLKDAKVLSTEIRDPQTARIPVKHHPPMISARRYVSCGEKDNLALAANRSLLDMAGHLM